MHDGGTTSGSRAWLRDDAALEVVYDGAVDAQVLTAVSGQALALGQEHDVWHVLTDCSRMTSDPSVFSLYDLAALLAQLGVSQHYREAIVLPDDPVLREGFEFYENTMANRGLEVRCFRERAVAVAWLAGA